MGSHRSKSLRKMSHKLADHGLDEGPPPGVVVVVA